LNRDLHVAEVGFSDFTGVLDKCRPEKSSSEPAPLLFLYSRSDMLIKAPVIEAFIQSSTLPGQARRCCFEGSHHVRHFERHRERYLAELEAFAGAIGL